MKGYLALFFAFSAAAYGSDLAAVTAAVSRLDHFANVIERARVSEDLYRFLPPDLTCTKIQQVGTSLCYTLVIQLSLNLRPRQQISRDYVSADVFKGN